MLMTYTAAYSSSSPLSCREPLPHDAIDTLMLSAAAIHSYMAAIQEGAAMLLAAKRYVIAAEILRHY